MEQRPPGWQGPVQHSIESPEVQFSTPAQSGHGAVAHGSGQSVPPFDAHSPVQQRGQPPAQTGSATSHPPVPRNALTPTPAAVQALNGAAAQSQANMEKRGPVEFNHAISYVNKIKVSFSCSSLILRSIVCTIRPIVRVEWGQRMVAVFQPDPHLLIDLARDGADQTPCRTVFKINRRSTNNSWKSCKRINASRSPFRTCTPKSQHCSTLPQIFWKTSSNSSQNQLRKLEELHNAPRSSLP